MEIKESVYMEKGQIAYNVDNLDWEKWVCLWRINGIKFASRWNLFVSLVRLQVPSIQAIWHRFKFWNQPLKKLWVRLPTNHLSQAPHNWEPCALGMMTFVIFLLVYILVFPQFLFQFWWIKCYPKKRQRNKCFNIYIYIYIYFL